jgi:hypothetical protein
LAQGSGVRLVTLCKPAKASVSGVGADSEGIS